MSDEASLKVVEVLDLGLLPLAPQRHLHSSATILNNYERTCHGMGPRMAFVVFGSLLLSPIIFLGAFESYLQDAYSRGRSGNVVVSGTVEAPGHIFSVTFSIGPAMLRATVASSDAMNQTEQTTAAYPYYSDFVKGQYSATLKNGQTYNVLIDYMGDGIFGPRTVETTCNAGTLNLNVPSDDYSYDVFCK